MRNWRLHKELVKVKKIVNAVIRYELNDRIENNDISLTHWIGEINGPKKVK